MRGKTKAYALYVLFAVLLVFMAGFLAGRLGLFKGDRVPWSCGKFPSGKKVAVVYLEGVLEESRDFLRELDEYRQMDDVKAIVVRIDSPGGLIVPSQEIYEEIRKLKGRKTVVASLGNVAASGGYYVACAAEEIVANPGTLTGSIGVVAVYQNFQDLMNKIGYKVNILKSGRFKDVGNPMRGMTEPEIALEQTILDNLHQQFIRDVATGRNKQVDEIKALADGRTFTGEQAMDVGLVDRLGNLQDSINRAGELSGIEGEPVVVYPPEQKFGIWEFMLHQVSVWVQIQLREAVDRFNPVSIHSSIPSIAGRE